MNWFQAFSMALELAPKFLGWDLNSPQAQETDSAGNTMLNDKDLALLNIKRKAGSVTVVVGTRETGKTELCYRYAEFLDRPTYAVSPQQRPPSWITWMQLEDVLERLPSKCTLILDDIPAYMSNRDYNEAFSRVVEKAVPMVRHEKQPPDYPIGEVHLIFSTQSTAQADRYILDADIAFFKPLGLLMDDIERPSIAKIYRNVVNPEFDGHDDYFIQRHAYMMSRSYKGLIEVSQAKGHARTEAGA